MEKKKIKYIFTKKIKKFSLGRKNSTIKKKKKKKTRPCIGRLSPS